MCVEKEANLCLQRLLSLDMLKLAERLQTAQLRKPFDLILMCTTPHLLEMQRA